jgi:hypothetical protein
MLLLVGPWRCRIPLAYFPVCIRLAVWYALSLMALLFSCGLIVEELRLLFGPWEWRGIIAGLLASSPMQNELVNVQVFSGVGGGFFWLYLFLSYSESVACSGTQ